MYVYPWDIDAKAKAKYLKKLKRVRRAVSVPSVAPH